MINIFYFLKKQRGKIKFHNQSVDWIVQNIIHFQNEECNLIQYVKSTIKKLSLP